MAMTLVSSATPNGTASNVIFNNIPQTGKNLLVLANVRSNNANATESFALFINDVSSATYNENRLRGTGSTAAAAQVAGNTRIEYPQIVGNGATANVFNSASYLFTNYTSSADKQVIIDNVNENNATAAQQLIIQGFVNTTAITKLEFSTLSGSVLVSGSIISLYIIS
jgi:hypothetical protein